MEKQFVKVLNHDVEEGFWPQIDVCTKNIVDMDKMQRNFSSSGKHCSSCKRIALDCVAFEGFAKAFQGLL